MVSMTQRVQNDDIGRLERHIGLSELGYQDISASLELDKAIHRWPLLAELSVLDDLNAALETLSLDSAMSSTSGRRPA